MLVVNRLTVPGNIRRVELSPDTVRIVLSDGTEKVYVCGRSREINLADPGALDAVADQREE